MQIKGIHFNDVWCGAGALGFVGEGYWWTTFGLEDELAQKITFVTKTITIEPNKGNVVLKENFQPARIIPETLRLNPFSSSITNKFSFSNPGLEKVLETGVLQKLKQPFFFSLGSVANTKEKRLGDFAAMCELLGSTIFTAPYGIQINYSCPNLEKGERITVEEIKEAVTIFSTKDVPVMLKLGIDTDLADFLALDTCEALDAFCFSNTRKVVRGGLSGRPLIRDNVEYVRALKEAGIKKPINAGGGILSKSNAREYFSSGADSVFIWSVFLLRPWRVKNIISNIYT